MIPSGQAHRTEAERRVLVVAPIGRDAEIARRLLGEGGMVAEICAEIPALCDAISVGCGTILLTEEAVRTADLHQLANWIANQANWSDLPIVLLTRVTDLDRVAAMRRYIESLGNVTFLERPFHPTTLLSVVRSALRSRDRQYQARAHLEEREERERLLRESETELLQHRQSLERLVEMRTAALRAANNKLRNEMAERARAEEALRHSQKMEAVGQLTGGLAHDFNNLLSAIMGSLELILRNTREDRTRRVAGAAMESVKRGAKLTAQLLAFARTQQFTLTPVDVNQLVTGMKDLLSQSVGVGISLELRPASGPATVVADANQLELAILNLAINARDAMPEGGELLVSVSHELDRNGHDRNMVCITVHDTGVGMSPEVIERAFEPFYTTKGVGKGTGLGLAQVYGVISQFGGHAAIESRVGEGTTVHLLLPAADTGTSHSSSAHGWTEPAALISAHAPATILVVDDDADVRHFLVHMLESLGYGVVEAATGGAALAALAGDVRPDLMIVDYLMPGMTGREVATAALHAQPDLPILFATGYAETRTLDGELAAIPVLRKPFTMAELSELVSGLVRAKGQSNLARPPRGSADQARAQPLTQQR